MKRLVCLFATAVVLIVSSCIRDPEPEPVDVVSVSVSPTTLNMEIGATSTLAATILPSNAANKAVIWTSDAPAVAAVDADGTVTALASGSATITAATVDGGFEAGCVVTVTEPEPDNILALIPDPVFLEFCLSEMGEWDTDGNGALSPAEAASVEFILCGNEDDYTGPKIASLEGIQYFTGVHTLYFGNHSVTSIDLSNNTELTDLECYNNGLSSIDLSDNPKLLYLYCWGNPLAELDLSANTRLESIVCRDNRLTSLILPENDTLMELLCQNNLLSSLDISQSFMLTILRCDGNPGDGVSTFPVSAWFDTGSIPSGWAPSRYEYDLQKGSWDSNGLEITVDYIQTVPPPPDPVYYTSTDYSADGRVTLLQQAVEGAGIDIVLMGDGYSDRLIADGTYARTMDEAMEIFFTEEPYRSLRGMFNVWSVDVVSPNELFAWKSSTALGCRLEEADTGVYGNNEACMEYALKAISDDRMDNALIIVTVNDPSWHGTCHLYKPTNYMDYPTTLVTPGDGFAIAYQSLGENPYQRGLFLHHEANGHGFAKLADEYWFDDDATISPDAVEDYRRVSAFGWYTNIDLTSDPGQVKWWRMLVDPRFSWQGLGVYEGGLVWGRGVWRSTENSIMLDNTGGFNAPSREAIYRRIHQLAYGPAWEYDYETFAAWDMAHYSVSPYSRAQTLGAGAVKPRGHTPPVVIPKSWREVFNE